jgi:hypothetical protein
VVATAALGTNNVVIGGSITASANATLHLEFFGNPSVAAVGEGRIYLGSATVKTDATGKATFMGSFSLPAGGIQSVTATATAANGDTSQFSAPLALALGTAPAIISANHTTFAETLTDSFTVKVTGFPTPKLSESGKLPAGVKFNAATGVLTGTPAAGTHGTYHLVFTASNGIGPVATQSFTLTVHQPPAITSANHATFVEGKAGSFHVKVAGFPTPKLSEIGKLPAGVKFNAATGVLGGTPAAGTHGTYHLTFTASNGVKFHAIQSFTLTVNQPPTPTHQQRLVPALERDVLDRTQPASAGEDNGWAGRGLDLLAIDLLFASSPEFHRNG